MKFSWKWLLILAIIGYVVVDMVQDESHAVDFDYYPPSQSKNTLAVLLHGGSWQAGSKLQLVFLGKYLASQGISVVNLNYRLSPTWKFDAPLVDIATVIKQVEKDKVNYGLSENYKLMILGFSAGGHLATQFCLNEDKYEVKQVDECVGLAGIYDLERIVKGEDGPLLVEAVNDFLGSTSPLQASPIYQIKDGEKTKFKLFWGENDKVVSEAQMRLFAETLNQHQAKVESTIVPQKDHLSIFITIPAGDEIAKKIIGE